MQAIRGTAVLFILACAAAIGCSGPKNVARLESTTEKPFPDIQKLRDLLRGLQRVVISHEAGPDDAQEQVMAIVRAHPDRSIAVLCPMVGNEGEDAGVRMGAAWALGELGDKRAVTALIDAFECTPAGVPLAAIEALGNIDDPELLSKLVGIYLGPNETLSVHAGLALAHLHQKAFVPQLVTLLKHMDVKMRAAAAQALGSIGDKAAVSALIVALDDRNEGVVMFAAQALGKIGDPTALAPLGMLAQRTRDVFVRKYALDAIEQINRLKDSA